MLLLYVHSGFDVSHLSLPSPLYQGSYSLVDFLVAPIMTELGYQKPKSILLTCWTCRLFLSLGDLRKNFILQIDPRAKKIEKHREG